jgi:hypothetical protein
MAGIDMPPLKHKIQGKSLHQLMDEDATLDRPYIVSESWSQAAIISKDYKLGIMLDPSKVKKQFDYRDFGDMFYDRSRDPLEIRNGIDDIKYSKQIDQLQSYYREFEQHFRDTGKQEIIQTFKN